MSKIDLTLSNPLIQGFFSGTSFYVPTAELIYIHTHLVSENFLSEIEGLILKANEKLLAFSESSPYKFEAHKAKLEKLMGGVTEVFQLASQKLDDTVAKTILYVLKDVYQFCVTVLNEEG